jgi:predicted alpha/beta-hydrolase family hydrolase
VSWNPEIRFDGSSRAPVLIALAHGAGAGMDSPFMEQVATGLAERGVRVARFEFPYMQRSRESGKRRPPDRAPVLLETWQVVIKQLQRRLKSGNKKLVIGGKSMGGRIASMVAEEANVDGLICLGYPFHPPGKPVGQRIEHLRELAVPTLIIQGERDAFGTRREVGRYRMSASIQVQWLTDGNHSFKPPKASTATNDENIAQSLDAMVAFVEQLPTGK